MKRTLLPILLCVPILVHAQSSVLPGRRSSSEALLQRSVARQQVDPQQLPPPQPVDTLYTPDVPFTSHAISMHGYAKRLRDARESFILRNETHNYRISRVVLRLVYSTDDGREIYRRSEVVECDIMPGASQTLTIKSFDKDKRYYYYPTPPQRASGIPYRVQYDVLRYDVIVDSSLFKEIDK